MVDGVIRRFEKNYQNEAKEFCRNYAAFQRQSSHDFEELRARFECHTYLIVAFLLWILTSFDLM